MPSPAASAKKAAAKKVTAHPKWKDMIIAAIVHLAERNGSSRQAIKKYVLANFHDLPAKIDTLFNQALKKAVESGELLQPKGASGPVKINKEERAALAPKKKQPSATAAPKIEASDVKKKVVRGNPRQKSENAPIPAKVLVEKVSARSSAKPGRKAEKRKVVTPTKAKSTAKKTAAKPKAALPEPVVVVTVARRSVSAKEKAVVAKKSAKATAVKGSANERKSSGTPKTSAARRGLRSGKK